jgi:membrane protein DedA with SNARE-associated domain
MNPDIALHIIIAYKYWMFVPLAFLVGGPVVALLSGLLTSLGYLDPLATYGMLLLCDLIPDTLYYMLGRHTNVKSFVTRFGKKIGMSDGNLAGIEHLWMKHTFKSMIFSKWAYGFSTALLMSAGMVKLPFRKYLTYTLSITIVQYIILFFIGFYFGASYKTLVHSIQYIEYIVAGALVLVIVGYFAFSLYVKRRFLRSQKELETA